jgi:hypothetical protein
MKARSNRHCQFPRRKAKEQRTRFVADPTQERLRGFNFRFRAANCVEIGQHHPINCHRHEQRSEVGNSRHSQNRSGCIHQSAPNTRMATVDHKITPDPSSIVAAHSVEAR